MKNLLFFLSGIVFFLKFSQRKIPLNKAKSSDFSCKEFTKESTKKLGNTYVNIT